MIAFAAVAGWGLWFWLRTAPLEASGARAADANGSNTPNTHRRLSGFAGIATAVDAGASADGCSADTVMDRDIDDPVFNKNLSARIRAAKQQWQSALVGSCDIRQRALGLALQGFAATSARHTDDSEAFNELATSAASTTDPVVYAIALRVCGKQPSSSSGSACDAISPGGWAQIDPENGAAWLEVASEAYQQRDLSAELDALHKAAGAHRVDSDTDSLLAIALPSMPAGLTLLEQYYLEAELTGLQAAFSLPYIRAAINCANVARGNPDLMKDCSAIADSMVATGRGIIDLSIGIRLGEKSGWPTQRVSELSRQRAALMMVMLGGPRDFDVPQSCQTTVREMEKMKRRSAIGEVSSLREEQQSSGLSVDDLAAQYDQWQAAIRSKVRAAEN